MKNLIMLMLIVGLQSCVSIKRDANGDCLEKCLFPDVVERDMLFYNKYTGDAKPDGKLVKKNRIITERTTKWEKKKADRNCGSSNPEDCMVWCLIEVPERILPYTEVVDTNQVKDFVRDSLIVDERLVSKGAYFWEKTVCQEKLTPELVSDVQEKLMLDGFDLLEGATGEYNEETQKALNDYQLKYELPQGNFNFKTMRHLGF